MRPLLPKPHVTLDSATRAAAREAARDARSALRSPAATEPDAAVLAAVANFDLAAGWRAPLQMQHSAKALIEARGGKTHFDEEGGLVIEPDDQTLLGRIAQVEQRRGVTVVYAPELLMRRGSSGLFHHDSKTLLIDTESIRNGFSDILLHERGHALSHQREEAGHVRAAHGHMTSESPYAPLPYAPAGPNGPYARDAHVDEAFAYVRSNIGLAIAELRRPGANDYLLRDKLAFYGRFAEALFAAQQDVLGSMLSQGAKVTWKADAVPVSARVEADAFSYSLPLRKVKDRVDEFVSGEGMDTAQRDAGRRSVVTQALQERLEIVTSLRNEVASLRQMVATGAPTEELIAQGSKLTRLTAKLDRDYADPE